MLMYEIEDRASFEEIKEEMENYANESCYKLEDVMTKTKWGRHFDENGLFKLSLEIRLETIANIDKLIVPVMFVI